MKNRIKYSVLPLLILFMGSCSTKIVEQEAPVKEEKGQPATLTAYMLETKTGYEIGADKATFKWVSTDLIDASVNLGSKVYTSVQFASDGEGAKVNFTDDGSFTALRVKYPGAALGQWAFYPSRIDENAQQNGYRIDWEISQTDEILVSIPQQMNYLAANPLSVVPLLGAKDGEGAYAFAPMTAVLAITVKNLTTDMDFISISYDDEAANKAAFSGTFTVSEGAITQATKHDDAGHSLRLNFSGLTGDHTFYFPIPAGEIPVGMDLIVGESGDPENRMKVTTKSAFTLTKGHITPVKAMTLTLEDQQWADYNANATFVDEFLWGQHSWSTSTTIPVTVQRSGLHPNKFRIANPYAAALTTFGYTPSTASTPDPYLVFKIQDNGKVYFPPFVTGVDAGGHQIQIKHPSDFGSGSTANSKVAATQSDGAPLDIELAPIYASYPYVSGQHWSRDGASQQHIHIVMSWDWVKVLDGTFIDTKIWGLQGWGATKVPVELYQNKANAKQFRVPNPYLVAKEQFGYETYTEGIVGSDYLAFEIQDADAVRFTTYNAGIEDKKPGGYPMKIWYPLDWGGSYTTEAGYNKVNSYRTDGLPNQIQLHPILSDVNPSHYSYQYKDQSKALTYLDFTEETWTSLGTGRFRDEEMWKRNSFAPYDVEVQIWRSDQDANRYRVANPYGVGNTAFKRTAAEAGGDEYLYLQVDPSNSQVAFGSLVTGMTWNKNGSPEQNNAATPAICNWVIADKAVVKSLLNKDISASSIVLGSAAAPEKIQLNVGYYDNGLNTYFYTSSLAPSYLWFPGAYNAGETWTDYSSGTYKDNIYDTKINGSSTLGTVAVTIQQSSTNPKRFRLANPYKQLSDFAALSKGTADDYLYFQYDNGLVYFETLYPGIQMDNSSRELAISHPVDANINSYYGTGSDFSGSSVVSSTSTGDPKKIQLGAYWYDKLTPTTNYCYTRGGNSWSESTRIVINFDTPEKAVVTRKQYPMLAAYHNPVEKLTLPTGNLEKVVVKITGVDLSTVEGLRLYQGGWMNNAYVAPDAEGVVTINSFTSATISSDIDINCWLSSVNVGDAIRFKVQEVVVDGVSLPIEQEIQSHYPGIVLNDANDEITVRGAAEVCKSFRIPAFCTTNAGTLIAAYDVRYDTSTDLQNDIDVGFRRSTDGGKTWSPLALCMDMGIWGYESQVAAGTKTVKEANQLNGIGDPCLLVDKTTGDIFCFGLWAHGKNTSTRSLAFAGSGYSPDDVPQLMMVKSSDDGLTWSEPINLTRQVKEYDWRVVFQGPGNGITMSDGTLVIANQHQKTTSSLHAGVMYSKDHGLTWHMHKEAHSVTSESCVVELEPGKLLLSMRDETNSHARRAYTTTDLGRTWTAHASNGQMIEPTCEASMIKIAAADNVTGKELILFSNPNSTSGRNHMTIQASTDKAVTWPYKVLFDEGGSLGYTCLTQIDASTVGVVYESSKGNIVFQAIPLTDIIQ